MTGQYTSKVLYNTFYSDIKYKGLLYPSVENAYQAQKEPDQVKRMKYTRLSTSQAIYYGNRKRLSYNWLENRDKIMHELLEIKFQDKHFREELLSSDLDDTIFYNTDHNNYWGFCTCEKCRNKNQNKLKDMLIVIKNNYMEETVSQ